MHAVQVCVRTLVSASHAKRMSKREAAEVGMIHFASRGLRGFAHARTLGLAHLWSRGGGECIYGSDVGGMVALRWDHIEACRQPPAPSARRVPLRG